MDGWLAIELGKDFFGLFLDENQHRTFLANGSVVMSFDHVAVEALAILSPEKFVKMIAYLHSPAAKRVRTNNHVERKSHTSCLSCSMASMPAA